MIIVTGAAGMIGSAVVWELNSRGRDEIIAVDHLGSGEKWRNLAPLRFRDYIEKEDFLALIAGAGHFPFGRERIEAIIHLGACSSTTEQDSSYLARNNFEYSKRLALYCFKKGARFIYASSAATYGDGSLGFSDSLELMPELRPLNAYGYSKQLFDLWLLRNCLLDKVTGLKYFNVFGPNEQHKGDMRSVVLKAFEQVTATGEISLFRSYRSDYADGEQLRDFIYLKDAAAMTLFFLDRPDATGIFNIGSGTARSWKDLAKAVFAALERPERISYIEMPEQLRSRYQYYTCADISRLRNAGYTTALSSLEDAVADYMRNYLLPDLHLGDGERGI